MNLYLAITLMLCMTTAILLKYKECLYADTAVSLFLKSQQEYYKKEAALNYAIASLKNLESLENLPDQEFDIKFNCFNISYKAVINKLEDSLILIKLYHDNLEVGIAKISCSDIIYFKIF